MKMQAMQSAIAVRRQRSRQEEAKKAKQRRESGASTVSTPRASLVSLDGHVYFDKNKETKRTLGHVTMFHVGGVLILIGLMLVTTALMPSYIKSTTAQRRSDLLGLGSFFVFLGGVFTTISRFISNNEDEKLNQYIKGRLSRSTSDPRLKDPEACLSLHKERRKSSNNGVHCHNQSSSHHVEPGVHSYKNGHVNADHKLPEGSSQPNSHNQQNSQQDPSSHSEGATSTAPVGAENNAIPHSASSEQVLSRILEEDEEYDGDASTEPLESSLSMSSSLETQALLEKSHSGRSGSKSSIKSSCKSAKIV